jgi:hypothetical protein
MDETPFDGAQALSGAEGEVVPPADPRLIASPGLGYPIELEPTLFCRRKAVRGVKDQLNSL